MPRAKLTIDVPEDTWIYEISTRRPDLVFEVIASTPGEDAGVGLVRLTVAKPLPVITEIQRRDDVTELELLWKHEDEALLQIETADPLLLLPIWRAGVPLTTPFDIQDGQATWETTTSRDRLSSLRSHLEDLGIDFSYDYIQRVEESRADRLLTDRQQEVLVAAVRAGYYATPREATLGDVADSLGVANATCSDILHRAEGHIIHWFVGEHTNVALPNR